MAQFEPGNPGKPKGAVSKLTRTVKEAFGDAFAKLQEDPEASYNLTVWGQNNPKEFYQLASKLIPAELNAQVTGSLFEVLSALGKPESGGSDNP